MDILRFITAGRVDDGKSTLIGRLLYDTKSVLSDQLEAIERTGKNAANGNVDLALLTDGLRAEREQGITIDVAYKYFSTSRRKFIIADAPGHIQYTRNMITGASNADLIIILVDARHGITEQTRRHSIIASILQLSHVVVAINKIDLVENAEDVYKRIVYEYKAIAKTLELKDVSYIPISALYGDNIVDASSKTPWYNGPTLLHILEYTELIDSINLENARLPIQYIIRPQTTQHHDYRGYAGKIVSGIYKKGDKVLVLPNELSSTIKSIEVNGQEVEEAFALQSVVLSLEDDIDISRGDIIVKQDEEIRVSREFDVLLNWMDSKPLVIGNRYLLQINSKLTTALVQEISYALDVNTLNKIYTPDQINLNEVARITIRTAESLAIDCYSDNKANGSAILIDETNFLTVAALLIQ